MKMITKVFLVIAILVICLLAWALFFNKGGILQNGWDGIAEQVNSTWQAITGSKKDVMPKWNVDDNNVEGAKDKAETGTP